MNGPSSAVGSMPTSAASDSTAAEPVRAVRSQMIAYCTIELVRSDTAWPLQIVKKVRFQ